MDYIKDLHELCDTISDAIREANEKIRSSGGKLTAGDTAYIDQLTHALKSVKAVIAMGDDGYSGRRYSMDNGWSGRNRDSMGRFSSRYSRDGNSGDGYSRGGDMVEDLRGLMENAPDERTRQEFRRFISKLESM